MAKLKDGIHKTLRMTEEIYITNMYNGTKDKNQNTKTVKTVKTLHHEQDNNG